MAIVVNQLLKKILHSHQRCESYFYIVIVGVLSQMELIIIATGNFFYKIYMIRDTFNIFYKMYQNSYRLPSSIKKIHLFPFNIIFSSEIV